MKLILNRISQDDTQTIGVLKIIGDGKISEFYTVELPWRDNQRNISCIPEGRYKAIKVDHDKFGQSLVVHNVPDRSGIMMHVANFHQQLRGCIAPGKGFSDLDKDGHVDVTNSRQAMDEIYEALADEFIIEVHDTKKLISRLEETGESMGI